MKNTAIYTAKHGKRHGNSEHIVGNTAPPRKTRQTRHISKNHKIEFNPHSKIAVFAVLPCLEGNLS
jgi:hypothetical protein